MRVGGNQPNQPWLNYGHCNNLPAMTCSDMNQTTKLRHFALGPCVGVSSHLSPLQDPPILNNSGPHLLHEVLNDMEVNPPLTRPGPPRCISKSPLPAPVCVLRWHCLLRGLQARAQLKKLISEAERFSSDQSANRCLLFNGWSRQAMLFMLLWEPARSRGALVISQMNKASRELGDRGGIRVAWIALGNASRDHVALQICLRNPKACVDRAVWISELKKDLDERVVFTQDGAPYNNLRRLLLVDTYAERDVIDFMAKMQHSFKHTVFAYVEDAFESRQRQRTKPCPDSKKHKKCIAGEYKEEYDYSDQPAAKIRVY